MKPLNINSHSDMQDELEWAFEEGYKLGIDDAKQGIFIDMDTVVAKFRLSISTDRNIN